MTEATWQEVEKEIKLVECLIRRLPDGEKAEAACRIAVDVVIWAGGTHYESLGILEEAKLRYRDIAEEVWAEEEEDADD